MNLLVWLIVGAGVSWSTRLVLDQVQLLRRKGPSRDEFVMEFHKSGIPDLIAGTVYDYYKSLAINHGYAVSPEDSYELVLHAGPQEIIDDAEDLLKRLRFEKPDGFPSSSWVLQTRTIRDMVLWLYAVRQQQAR